MPNKQNANYVFSPLVLFLSKYIEFGDMNGNISINYENGCSKDPGNYVKLRIIVIVTL